MAAVAAAAAGEDLELRGAVSPAVLAGAERNLSTMAGWWGWRVPRITAERAEPAVAEPDRGTGLFFTRGIDSWSSLLTLQAEGAGPTHLLTIRDIELPRDADTHAEVLAETQRVAARLGLPLVELSTDARELLDPHRGLAPHPRRGAGRVRAAPPPAAGPRLRRRHPRSALALRVGQPPRPRAPLEQRDVASSCTTRPSWTARRRPRSSRGRSRPSTPCSCAGRAAAPRNCGRCPKCLRTMTALDLVGALERCPTFDAPLTAEAVRAASPPDTPAFVREILALLPPGELRAAWERHLPSEVPGHRLVTPPTDRRWPGAATGPGSTTRWPPPAARADPADAGPELVLGWEPGMVPLRPRAGTHRAVRSRIATHAARATPWVVADLADQFQRNDPWPATVAERVERLWGPGLCYLAGIGWGDPTAPVLGPEAVGRLLDRGPHPRVVEPGRHARPAPRGREHRARLPPRPGDAAPPGRRAAGPAPAPAGAARHRPRGPGGHRSGGDRSPCSTTRRRSCWPARPTATSRSRSRPAESGQPCLTSGPARPAAPATSPVGPRPPRRASSGSTPTRRRSTRRCGRRSSGSTRWRPASTGSRPGSTGPARPPPILDAELAALDGAVAGQAEVLRRLAATPARDAELARLRGELGPSPAPSSGPQRLHDLLEPRRPAAGRDRIGPRPPRSPRRGPPRRGARARRRLVRRVRRGGRRVGRARRPRSGWSTRRRTSGSPAPATRCSTRSARRHAFQLDADNTAVAGGRRGRLRGRPALRGGVHLRHGDQGRSGGAGPRRHLERAGLGAVAPVQLHRHDGGGRRGGAAAAGRLAGGPGPRARRRLGARPPHRPGRRAHRLRARDRRPLPRAARSVPPLGARPPDRARSRRPHLRPDPAAAGRRRRRLRGPPRPRPAVGDARRGRPTSRPRRAGPRRRAPPLDGRDRLLVVASGGVENLGDDAITVAGARAPRRHRARPRRRDRRRPADRPARDRRVARHPPRGGGGLRPADLEDDDRVAGAAARVQVGRLDHRPVEPGRYRAAVLPRRRQPHVALGRRARRPARRPRLRAAAGRRAVRAERAGPRPARRRGPGTGRPARRGRPGRGRPRRGGARRRWEAPATGDDALLLAVEPPARDRGALPRAQPPRRRLRGRDRGRARRAGRRRSTRTRAERGLTVLGVPFNDQPGVAEVDTLLRAGPHGVTAVGPVAGRATTTRIPGGWPRCWPAPARSSRHSYHAALLGLGGRRPGGARRRLALLRGEGRGARASSSRSRPSSWSGRERRSTWPAGSPPWPRASPGAASTRARAGVVAWWDATIGDLLAAGRASGGQRLSSSAAPTKGHTSGSTTGSSGWGRTA